MVNLNGKNRNAPHPLFAILLLVGCAPTYTWQNPQLNPADADRQREIDKAECTVYGMNSVPVPNHTA